MRSVLAVLATALVLLLVHASAPASAEVIGTDIESTSDGGVVAVSVSGSVGGSSEGAADCSSVQLEDGTDVLLVTELPVSELGLWWFVTCTAPDGAVSYSFFPVGSPPPVVVLVAAAEDRLVLPAPDVRLAPDAAGLQVVQLGTWLWVDPADWRLLAASASVAGVSVTLTATPLESAWDMGDGSVVRCAGPGSAWVPGVTSGQSPDCGYTYTATSRSAPGGMFMVTGVVYWARDWVCAPACGSGSLPTLAMATSVPVTVGEIQAINIAGPGRRNGSWMAAGGLIVVAGALGFALWAASLGDRTPVLVAARDVAAGEVLVAADLGVADVAADGEVATVPAGDLSGLVGLRAATNLAAGQILAPGSATGGSLVGAGEAVVGVALEPGAVPTGSLRVGDPVQVVELPADTLTVSDTAAGGPVAVGTVFEIDAGDGTARTVVVSLLVDAADAPAVAVAAGAGRVRLVLLPPDSNPADGDAGGLVGEGGP